MIKEKYRATVRNFPQADGKAFLASRDGFISKSDREKLDALFAELKQVEDDLAKWIRPAAEAEIIRRKDPRRTPAEIAAFSNESDDAMLKRYEDTAAKLSRVVERIRKDSRPLFLTILEKLDPVIADAMSAVESSNRETAERNGVSYDPLQDQVLNGLAAFREMTHNRLSNESVPLHPKQLERFLGVLKPKKSGLFS